MNFKHDIRNKIIFTKFSFYDESMNCNNLVCIKERLVILWGSSSLVTILAKVTRPPLLHNVWIKVFFLVIFRKYWYNKMNLINCFFKKILSLMLNILWNNRLYFSYSYDFYNTNTFWLTDIKTSPAVICVVKTIMHRRFRTNLESISGTY